MIELKEWLVETYNGGDDEDEDEEETGDDGGRNGSRRRQKWERIKFCDACKDIITFVSCSLCKPLYYAIVYFLLPCKRQSWA